MQISFVKLSLFLGSEFLINLTKFIIQSAYAVPLMGKVHYFAFVYSIVTYYSLARLATPGNLNKKILLECGRHTVGAAYFTFFEKYHTPQMVTVLSLASMLSLVVLSLMIGWNFFVRRPKSKRL